MGLVSKHILLISSGQPSLNPRLVKEADALIKAGHRVTVLYQYWNKWGTELDKTLLAAKKWNAYLVGGSPFEKRFTYFKSRLLYKMATILIKKIGLKGYFTELAIGRCTSSLTKKAKGIKADIYIAHNLAALPAAVLAAQKNNSKCGFDAEDFHRNEQFDDPENIDVELKKYIEDKYIPQLDYLSTASPLISLHYKKLYPDHTPITILNVFPRQHITRKEHVNKAALKLFWFSQTIGSNRGLEIVIEAISLLKELNIELHLLGNHNAIIRNYLRQLANKHGMNKDFIFYYLPIAPDEIFEFASNFDIGLATEISNPKNRDICLTNKIFTYLQSGLAIIATDTVAQTAFLDHYPGLGYIFDKNSAYELSEVIRKYITDPTILQNQQDYALHLAQSTLNWENESQVFVQTINQLILNSEAHP